MGILSRAVRKAARTLRINSRPLHGLDGDRAIEWSWVVAKLPPSPSRVLDFGCVQSSLTGIAARLGHTVTAIDLRPIEYRMDRVRFVRGNVNEAEFGHEKFDCIMNSSTVEHVGLAGRYGAVDDRDGDLEAMRKLGAMMADGGRMILTVPVGLDAVFAPYHRVYGECRLPRLLEGYGIIEEEYWAKQSDSLWEKCDRGRALATTACETYYALGLFVLYRSCR